MLHHFAFAFSLKLMQVTNTQLLCSPELSCSNVFVCLMPETKLLILDERKSKVLRAETTYQGMWLCCINTLLLLRRSPVTQIGQLNNLIFKDWPI